VQDAGTPPAPTWKTQPKVSPPPEFSGDRSGGRVFLNYCGLYLHLCSDQFQSDEERILWAISFFKTRHAAKWADEIFAKEEHDEAFPFLDWNNFVDEFWDRFLPVNAEVDAINTLEGTGYYQGNRGVDDYLDEFKHLVSEAGYKDSKTIVVKFHHGLKPAIQNQIATMASRCPGMSDFTGWYSTAQQINHAWMANEAFHASQCSVPPPPPT
jgi:hypothetical protein